MMITSPLRYPGGKAKLFPFFVGLINSNNLFSHEYCEPYAGGAGLALQLLGNGFVERISINDIDRSVYAFWIAALQHTDKFCKLIEKTPITITEWRHQKEIWTKENSKDLLRLGFATYFLNRTNRSGIIDGAGPIGGFDQTGNWKIDARLVKDRQIENIQSIARFRKQIAILNLDAAEFIQRKFKIKECLTYLDPPYFVKGQKLYKNFYEPNDHEAIAKTLTRRRNLKWVVSYDDVRQIRAAYKEFSPIKYKLNYSAGPKFVGSEVIFLSDALTYPNVTGFNIAA